MPSVKAQPRLLPEAPRGPLARELAALGDDFLVAVVNEVFGVLYTYIDEYDRAIQHYRLALDGYEELAYVGYVAEAIYGLATAHRYAGEYDTAVAAFENERQELRIELLQEQARVRSLELEKQRRDLRQQRLLVALLLVAGLVLAVIVLWRVRETRRWRELSTRDVLTGVHNRRHAFARLESLLADLDPARGQLSLLLLDLDDFKTINDRHGHPVGDRVLQAVASALAGLLRPGDELARVGGEEFLLLLPRTGEEGALAVAARVGETIRELAIPSGGGATLRVSASIGVAAVTPARASADALYTAVDAALYRAKTAGKDRIEAAPAD
jgi:diguanylate cyclase (GGDEF)-like protein